ncbi:hypothetical protein Glove_168g154 [Diversispora epigaea]|uniref:Uncharacterized protein n=1 Tax=Diversispora epigaea TaxID=1348612 RepID=A0A397IPT0_9GLOM|nr:hypothetical protein Glove_168g154 [Diversispora epigaea]
MNDIYDKFTNSQTNFNSYFIFTQPDTQSNIPSQTTTSLSIICSSCKVDTSVSQGPVVTSTASNSQPGTFLTTENITEVYIPPNTVVIVKAVTAGNPRYIYYIPDPAMIDTWIKKTKKDREQKLRLMDNSKNEGSSSTMNLGFIEPNTTNCYKISFIGEEIFTLKFTSSKLNSNQKDLKKIMIILLISTIESQIITTTLYSTTSVTINPTITTILDSSITSTSSTIDTTTTNTNSTTTTSSIITTIPTDTPGLPSPPITTTSTNSIQGYTTTYVTTQDGITSVVILIIVTETFTLPTDNPGTPTTPTTTIDTSTTATSTASTSIPPNATASSNTIIRDRPLLIPLLIGLGTVIGVVLFIYLAVIICKTVITSETRQRAIDYMSDRLNCCNMC